MGESIVFGLSLVRWFISSSYTFGKMRTAKCVKGTIGHRAKVKVLFCFHLKHSLLVLNYECV